MSRSERWAWFELSIVLVALAAFLALLAPLGFPRAQGAFGVLGLLGLGVFAFRRRGAEIVVDERDQTIITRSQRLGLSVVYLWLIASAVLSGWIYGERGTVPVIIVQAFAWLSFLLLVLTRSLATIVQYRRS